MIFHQKCIGSIRQHWSKYSKYFRDLGELTHKEIYERKFFNLNEWLIKDDFIKLTSKEYSAIQIVIMNELKNDFFNSDIYSFCTPSLFAVKTLMNKKYMDNENLDKVYILSRNITDAQKESKLKFISKYFNHPKIEYINVDKRENKGKVLKDNKIQWNILVDDEIPNIRDIVEEYKDDLEGKEFLIPEYGYNKIPEELKIIIDVKGSSINYYDPFEK